MGHEGHGGHGGFLQHVIIVLIECYWWSLCGFERCLGGSSGVLGALDLH